MMTVSNPKEAGQRVATPSGPVAEFDANGYAEVPNDCGLDLIPGYAVVKGTPTSMRTVENTVIAKPVRMVVCQGPLDMADTPVAAPYGDVIAKFNEEARALVPDNCGLNKIPGYKFLEPEAPELAESEEPEEAVEGDGEEEEEEQSVTPPTPTTSRKPQKPRQSRKPQAESPQASAPKVNAPSTAVTAAERAAEEAAGE